LGPNASSRAKSGSLESAAGDDLSRTHAPTMITTDLALRFDPVYEPISRRFLEHPEELTDAFARAWYKLTHRYTGPIARYLGPEVPTEELRGGTRSRRWTTS
jgi:catalase-peroxidase